MVVDVPVWLSDFANVLFNLNGAGVDFSGLVIFFTLLACLILIIKELMSTFDFGRGIMGWAISIVASLLISISGGINQLGSFFAWLAGLFGMVSNGSAAVLIFTLLVVVIIAFGIIKLLSILKKQFAGEGMYEAGLKVGTMSKRENEEL